MNRPHAMLGLLALGGLMLGCSDPVPPPAQGAMSMRVAQQPSGMGSTCARVHNNLLGEPALSEANAGTVKRIIDKQNGAQVSCSVKSSGGGFTVSGSLTQGSSRSFSVSTLAGETLAPGVPALATMTEFSPDALSLASSPTEPCQLTVEGNLEVAAGRVWAKFHCNTFWDESSTGNATCQADGVFLFENCKE